MDRTLPALEIADVTNHAAGTAYYPSAAGLDLLDAPLLLPLALTAEDVTVAVEVSVDGATWTDVTHCGEALGVGFLGGPVVFPAGAVAEVIWQIWWVRAERVRVAATFPDATNRLIATIGRRKP